MSVPLFSALRIMTEKMNLEYFMESIKGIYGVNFSRMSEQELFDTIWSWFYSKCTYFYSYMLSYTKSGYTEAENLLKKSLEIAEHIIQEKGDTDDNILILATSLDYLGYILSNSLNNDIIRITLADTYLKEAVMLRQILCSAHPEHYRLMHDYAWSLDNLGAFYTKIDVRNINFDTKQESNGIIHLTEEEIVQNKRHTEALLKEALEIRLALSKARGDECSTEVAWTYFNLAELIYNNLVDDSNSNDINRFLNIALRQNKLQNAETYINKALDIYHRLDQRYPGQHMSSEARTTALYVFVMVGVGPLYRVIQLMHQGYYALRLVVCYVG